MARIPILIALLLIFAAPVALATNCPPNAFHCQALLPPLGTQATVYVEVGASTDPPMGASIYQAMLGGSAYVWAKVYVAANSSVLAANVSLNLSASAGITFPNGTSQAVLATTSPTNLSFPFTVDPDFAPGDHVFLTVTAAHLDEGGFVTGQVPVKTGAVAPLTIYIPPSLKECWALILGAVVVGGLVGFGLGRMGGKTRP